MKKIICTIFVAMIATLSITTFVYAHRGRTDSNGGHYDRSTGEYHYHHGYPAHQHINGVCPYDYDDKTSSSSSSSINTPTIIYNSIKNYTYTNTSSAVDSINTANNYNSTVNTQSKNDNSAFWIALIILFWWLPISIIANIVEFFKKKFKKTQKTIIDVKPAKVQTIKTTNTITAPTPTRNYFTCPRCGGQLQVKQGKYGKFIGCKNYPRCKYTKNIKK